MMTELLLETATDICSVAVRCDGELVGEATATDVHQHASHLTLLIQRAIREAGCSLREVSAVVLSDGPGSYTSLRVGAATAKGLCLALPQLQLVTVPTLAALAWASEAGTAGRIMATINSRRGEVFGQIFDAAELTPLTEVMNVRLTDPKWRGSLLAGAGLGRIAVCGPGQGRVHDALDGDNAFSFVGPDRAAARYLATSAAESFRRQREASSYEPFYLNAPFVTKSKKKSLL